MLKILWTSFQHYVNWDVQAGFRKRRGTRDQLANNSWSTEKARKFQEKKIHSCFIDCAKAFDCVDHRKLWKILRDGNTRHFICLLRNLYSGQEATVRTRHGTTDWFILGKEYIKAVYCHSINLTFMQSTWCDMLDWMNHRLESRVSGEISITSDMTMKPL